MVAFILFVTDYMLYVLYLSVHRGLGSRRY
jgi:hypothetical protein